MTRRELFIAACLTTGQSPITAVPNGIEAEQLLNALELKEQKERHEKHEAEEKVRLDKLKAQHEQYQKNLYQNTFHDHSEGIGI